MTARGIYEAILIELSKVNAPALKLHEFNYLCNKAVNQFINEVYNVYDINQQTTDDIRVLKSTAYLKPEKVEIDYPRYNNKIRNNAVSIKDSYSGIPTFDESDGKNNIYRTKLKTPGATYQVFMPQDYLHLLNCVCIYYINQQNKCYDVGDIIQVPAKRLTADSWSSVLTDIYNRPTPLNPYYYIHNVNTQIELPTNPLTSKKPGTDMAGEYNGVEPLVTNEVRLKGSNFNRTVRLKLGDSSMQNVSVVEKPIALRVSNPTNVRCEIRYGQDDTVYKLIEVQVEYLKSPQFIRLTQEQIDLTTDTSQIMEFPDYICQEIINKLVILLLERAQDPRLATNVQINHTIARPTEQQQQQTINQA